MKKLWNRIRRTEGGFTLIELIIVIAILAILAAVALPNFSGITNRGQASANATELVTVQTAMDVMMANQYLQSVTATTSTNDMAAFPTGNPLYPNYLRSATTSANYTCDSTGKVTTP